MKSYKILVCDDEPAFLDLYDEVLMGAGFAVVKSARGEDCLRLAVEQLPDLILLDVKLPGMSGFETCAALKKGRQTQYIPLIFVTATFQDVADRVSGIEMGADDYITKPFCPDELIVRVKALLRTKELQEKLAREQASKTLLHEEILSLEAQLKDAQLAQSEGARSIIGRNPRMEKIVQLIESIKDTVANVLILGETGTGKGLLAEAIHKTSARKDGPFMKVDCSALTETLLESELFGHEVGAFTGAVKRRQGRFERAHGGTVFLDEIGEIPMDLQAKLLRVVQDNEFERVGGDETIRVDVRIIAATNVVLERAVEQRTFRKDLYYRLNVICIDLPPLRERPEDIPLLVHHFLGKYAQKNSKQIEGVGEDAMRALLDYGWPGNVRELENVIERAVVLCPGRVVTPDLVMLANKPAVSRETSSDRQLKDILADMERDIIEGALKKADGSVDRAAKALGLNRTTLYSKLKKYGIPIP
ncbi:MAG: sigma-54-dependent Fis family transcriptional regulator [Candidatus Riflebacteria bacterium]|nr:sigma-54-dependent Fis family transcriptional regulator [Candidatus Riflebacteria bacterium]